jgi:hypothetical protein
MAMVQSEQQELTRRQSTRKWRSRGSASNSGFWALAAVALLIVVLAVSVAGCGSNSQATATTSATVASSGQSTTGQSTATGGPSGSVPSGTRPAGGPGGTTPSSDTSGTSTTTTEAVASSTTTTSVAPTTTTSLSDDQHGDGIYKAGTDISSGLYKGTAVGENAHWEISKDANGARYVASADPTGPFYVKVTSGYYLKLSGVIIEKASTDAADPLASKDLTNGTYRVGYDIEAGWYTGTVTGDTTMGYWQISSDANGQTLVANDYPLGPFTFKVKSGQFLTLRGVTVSLQAE